MLKRKADQRDFSGPIHYPFGIDTDTDTSSGPSFPSDLVIPSPATRKPPISLHTKPLSFQSDNRHKGGLRPQSYKYIAVLDFEATCEEHSEISPQEIIEIPVILVDSEKRKVIAEFHKFVKPLRIPRLSKFCTDLTGVQQNTVDVADSFHVVFDSLLSWLLKQNLIDMSTKDCMAIDASKISVLFVTCGDWDFKTMLPGQCSLSKIPIPPVFKCWMNVKKSFKNFYGGQGCGMAAMLQRLGIPLQGRVHSGIDDSRNIAAIVMRMLEDGYVAKPTWNKSKDVSKHILH